MPNRLSSLSAALAQLQGRRWPIQPARFPGSPATSAASPADPSFLRAFQTGFATPAAAASSIQVLWGPAGHFLYSRKPIAPPVWSPPGTGGVAASRSAAPRVARTGPAGGIRAAADWESRPSGGGGIAESSWHKIFRRSPRNQGRPAVAGRQLASLCHWGPSWLPRHASSGAAVSR